MRLLAAVPSVVYGLIGILVLVPFVGNHLITPSARSRSPYVVQLDRHEPARRPCVILTVMITPIMVAIIVDALRSVPRSWTEGAAALGVNRWRVMWTISVRAARPAIVAAARARHGARARRGDHALDGLGLGRASRPNPLDGLTFFFEPTRPLAATIVDNAEGLSVEPFGQTLYAFAAVLLVSSVFLSLAGWAAQAAAANATGWRA